MEKRWEAAWLLVLLAFSGIGFGDRASRFSKNLYIARIYLNFTLAKFTTHTHAYTHPHIHPPPAWERDGGAKETICPLANFIPKKVALAY